MGVHGAEVGHAIFQEGGGGLCCLRPQCQMRNNNKEQDHEGTDDCSSGKGLVGTSL